MRPSVWVAFAQVKAINASTDISCLDLGAEAIVKRFDYLKTVKPDEPTFIDFTKVGMMVSEEQLIVQ